MIDSHCHLDGKEFEEDLDAVLKRCAEQNVTRVISCGTDVSSSEKNAALAEKYPMIYAAAGIHPHEAYRIEEDTLPRLKALAGKEKVVAIGETGLDYFYNFSLPEVQRKALRLHIRLAREVKLPLIVHCRNAEEDLIEILKEENAAEAGGVIHCFTGSRETALACLELGFYLGVSGIATFKTAVGLADIFAGLPSERLLVETDSPYLAPVPHRGKRNEPSFVVHTAAKLAELKKIAVEEIEAFTTKNAETLFRLSRHST